MASFNHVVLMGNLTRDPEIRSTASGQQVAAFGLAVSRKYKDKAGNLKDETSFFDIEAWGPQTNTIAKYLTKGACLLVDGELRQETWEDKQSGQKRSKVKVICIRFTMVGNKPGANKTQHAQQPAQDDLSVDPENVPF